MDSEYCGICESEVPGNNYDYEVDMCRECRTKLFTNFRKADRKKANNGSKHLQEYVK